MDNRVATLIEQRPRLTVLGLLVLVVVLVGVICIAPPLIALIVAAMTAAGWCWWLETSPPEAWSSAGCESESTTTNAAQLGVVSRAVRRVDQWPAEPRDVSLS